MFVIASLVASLALLGPGIVEYARTRQITLHWSRIIVGAFGLLLVFQTLVTAVLLRILALWKYQLDYSDARFVQTEAALSSAVPPMAVALQADREPE